MQRLCPSRHSVPWEPVYSPLSARPRSLPHRPKVQTCKQFSFSERLGMCFSQLSVQCPEDGSLPRIESLIFTVPQDLGTQGCGFQSQVAKNSWVALLEKLGHQMQKLGHQVCLTSSPGHPRTLAVAERNAKIAPIGRQGKEARRNKNTKEKKKKDKGRNKRWHPSAIARQRQSRDIVPFPTTISREYARGPCP